MIWDDSSSSINIVKTFTSKLKRGNETNDYVITMKNNKISLAVNGEMLVNEKEINNLHGDWFGFRLFAEGKPMTVEIEDFRFDPIY